MEEYRAENGKVYVYTKGDKILFGEIVFILPTDDYTIEDFTQVDKNLLENYIKGEQVWQ
jgi:hypothetical protein